MIVLMLVQKESGPDGVKLDIIISAAEFDTLAQDGAVAVDDPTTTFGFPDGIETVTVRIGQ